jgi:PKD domain
MKTQQLAACLWIAALAGCGGGDEGSSTAGVSQPPTSSGTDPAARMQVQGAPSAGAEAAASQVAPMYALDFVSTAASGYGLNDAGDVVGKAYTDPGCGPFCLPPQQIVVWRNGSRIVLPDLAGANASTEFPTYINNQGLVGGVFGIPGSSTRAAAWIPSGNGYLAQDIGVAPGTSSAEVFGIDDLGRMVGWSTQGGAIPTLTIPFMWTQAGGIVDLRALGYPNERPAAISRGGKVVTWGSWYQLGDPASVVQLPALPSGFLGVGVNGSAINDNGDQAHLLVSVSGQNLRYPYRLSNGGTWQLLTAQGSGNRTRSGIGSINAGQDVTFTAASNGFVAAGPDGTGQPLAALISPAYAGAAVSEAGVMNSSGQILAQAYVGRSPRLVKLTPTTACGSNCLVSSALQMSAQFVEDPAFAGSCFQGGKMYNQSAAAVTITDEAGTPLAGAQVRGRFLDDYWTDRPVSGSTNAAGVVSFAHRGLCGVGAIAFLIDGVSLGTRSLDRTRGTLAASVIPSIAPPSNEAPVALARASCTRRRVCTLDGSRSYDPDGNIVAYQWTDETGTTLSNQAVFTKTYTRSGRSSATLTVTDNGGLSASRRVAFTVPR